ncbi:TRAP transporter small permease [Primorskyibacter marinus]|uniref:TRAP transporter small permease n=1 Tax=Primorskyibacter marinus TaxID=1977320 RepID=UPI001E54EEFA|nr:TRAP transporter small permease subunit [Primorskyibacter marinus]
MSVRVPEWFRGTDRALDLIASLFQILAEGLLATMLACNLLNLVMRNSGAGSLLWVGPWTGVMMVWAVFFGFYVIYRRQLDIALSFAVARFSPRIRRAMRVLTGICAIIVAGVIVLETPQILARQRGTIEIVDITRYWLSVPMIVSSAFIVLHFAFDIVAVLFGWHEVNPEEDLENLQW